jgi:hypothetical protein
MNSKQRRNQRVFEHEVTIVCRNNERYFEFDRKVEIAKQWLQWNTKRKNYMLGRRCHDKQSFKFRNAGMASIFALKFL